MRSKRAVQASSICIDSVSFLNEQTSCANEPCSHFNAAQHTATHCNTLQHTAPAPEISRFLLWKSPILLEEKNGQNRTLFCKRDSTRATEVMACYHDMPATHCNTLQHGATRCTTLAKDPANGVGVWCERCSAN